MNHKFKQIFWIRFLALLFSFFLVSSFFTIENFTNCHVWAQDGGDEEPVDEETIVTIDKTSVVLINREITEVLKLQKNKDELLVDEPITVTVDDPLIASISILNPTEDDQVIVKGSVLIAKTGKNGQKAFVIKGLASGSTAITFEVIADNGTADPVVEQLTVNVLELEAVIQADKNIGEAPLDVQFFDKSVPTTNTRIWSFGDGDLSTSDERNPVHTFENSGLFNVTLEVTASFNFGTLTDTTSTSIGVIPADSGLPGSIFGIVFDSDLKVPLSRVEILLLSGNEEKLKVTGRDGAYRFDNVFPGSLIFTLCKGLLYECQVQELTYDGGPLALNFTLKKRELPEEAVKK